MTDSFIKGISLGLLLAISVGPIVFTVIKQSITNGYKSGLAFIAGISVSDILLVVCSNVFTNLFAVLSAHKKVLAIIASIFLILVGVYFVFFKKAEVPIDVENKHKVVTEGNKGYVKTFAAGFIMNIFNPGIIVFWLTWATTFIDHTLNQRLAIFGTALFIALIADVAKVLLANKIRDRLTPKNIHLVNRINGLILMGFGVVIIILQR